jgi:hypothetical protein
MWNLLTHRPHMTVRKGNLRPNTDRNFGVNTESGSSVPVIADPDPDPNPEEARRSAPKAGKRGSLDEQAKVDQPRSSHNISRDHTFASFKTSLRHE